MPLEHHFEKMLLGMLEPRRSQVGWDKRYRICMSVCMLLEFTHFRYIKASIFPFFRGTSGYATNVVKLSDRFDYYGKVGMAVI